MRTSVPLPPASRRALMAEVIGVPLHEDILPTSNTPLCLAPFWFWSDHLPAVN